MASAFLGGKKKSGEDVVLFEIRGNDVGVSIVRLFSINSRPKILYFYREAVERKEYSSSKELTESMVQTLKMVSDKVSEEIKNDRLKKVDINLSRAVFVYSSPWFISQTQEVLVEKEKPFLFTKKLFERILKAESSLEKIKNCTLIEKEITYITLNGYPLSNPINKKSSNVKASVLTSIIPTETLKEVEMVIKEKLDVNFFEHHTFPLSFFTTLRSVFPNVSNFLFFDIGEKITDIGTVHTSSLQNLITMPSGGSFFFEEIKKITNASDEELKEAIGNFGLAGSFSKPVSVDISGAVQVVKTKWIENIHNALSSVTDASHAPHTVFVLVDQILESLVSSILESTEAQQTIAQSSLHLNVIVLKSQDFELIFDSLPGLKPEILTILNTIFLHNHRTL